MTRKSLLKKLMSMGIQRNVCNDTIKSIRNATKNAFSYSDIYEVVVCYGLSIPLSFMDENGNVTENAVIFTLYPNRVNVRVNERIYNKYKNVG